MKKIFAALCLLVAFSNGCYMDEVVADSPPIVYYNGSYGYWYNNVWYVAPPGFVYGHRIYWGPYRRGGYYPAPRYGFRVAPPRPHVGFHYHR